MKKILLTSIMCIFVILPSRTALAGVVVFDRVGVTGKAITLSAQTKGRFFAMGGEIVEFVLGGKTIGKTLSGGDGFAFLEFVPKRKGMETLLAQTDDEEGTGVIQIVERGGSIVFIDVIGSIIEQPLLHKPRKGSQESVRDIAARFSLVYIVTGFPGEGFIKEWLADYGYPRAAVIPWKDGRVFDDIVGMGLKIKAVIGSASVIESLKKHKPLALSFEETEGAKNVKSWEEIPPLMK